MLRPLETRRLREWREVRRRNVDWLTKWEPRRIPGQADVVENRDAFAARCSARAREWQLGTGYGFGIFTEDGDFAGEINLSSVQRGPFQNAYVGYWIDETHAGQGYTPEARRGRCPLRVRGARPAPPADGHHPPQRAPAGGSSRSWRSAKRASPCATSRSTACGRTTSATPSPPRSGTRGATSCWRRWIREPPIAVGVAAVLAAGAVQRVQRRRRGPDVRHHQPADTSPALGGDHRPRSRPRPAGSTSPRYPGTYPAAVPALGFGIAVPRGLAGHPAVRRRPVDASRAPTWPSRSSSTRPATWPPPAPCSTPPASTTRAASPSSRSTCRTAPTPTSPPCAQLADQVAADEALGRRRQVGRPRERPGPRRLPRHHDLGRRRRSRSRPTAASSSCPTAIAPVGAHRHREDQDTQDALLAHLRGRLRAWRDPRLLAGDLLLEGGQPLLERRLVQRPHLRVELALDRGGVVVDVGHVAGSSP